ncbi:MAG: M20 family metallopeptidase [Ruminococcaceae bacterium]|nr:M20 family metallopeptidase [Oscillospiraceae bacterium]
MTDFEAVEALYDRYVAVWEDICNLESPTEDKAAVDRVSAYIIGIAREHGWQVEVCPQAEAGDAVCITMNPHAPGTPVALSGHMDTVHPIGSFGTPAVHRDAEKIYGPGVTDCKGGLVVALLAMHALEKTGFDERPVLLLLQSDEEGGSKQSNKATIRYICQRAQGVEAFINLEGHTYGEACLIRKGIATYTFTVTGVEAHSSRCAFEGASAVAEAARKILRLEELKDREGITCNCGTVSGGSAVNTVPGQCTFTANFRFVNEAQRLWIERFVQEVAADNRRPECTCTVEKTGSRLAMEDTPRNRALLDKMNAVFARVGLSPLAASARPGGSDAAEITAAGIPCVDNMGAAGDRIHSPDEFAYLDSLRENACRLTALVRHL